MGMEFKGTYMEFKGTGMELKGTGMEFNELKREVAGANS